MTTVYFNIAYDEQTQNTYQSKFSLKRRANNDS